jgi:pimeloyl-ACP methyl ester carboxylesterase/DNA-binding CsgD family transcriptional regulator
MASQEIRFCETRDGVKIAYSVEGSGPPLVFVNRWGWSGVHYREHPLAAALLERLARERTVVSYDRRGIGSSQRDITELSHATDLDDLEAVVEAAKLQRFDMVGDHDGAHLAAAYCVRHPKRVRRLVLLRVYRDPKVVYDPAAMEQLANLIDTSWQLACLTMGTWALRGGPPEMVPWFIDMLNRIVSPEVARRYVMRLPHENVAGVLASVPVPAFVAHWRDDPQVGLDHARAAAALLPHGRIIVVDAPDAPWMGRDPFVVPILGFLNEGEAGDRPDGLTERELEILALLAAGKSNQEIAHELSISARTAERHIGNIYLKIGVHNRAEATAYAFRNGITPPSSRPA